MDDILNTGNVPYVSEASVSVEIETEDMTLNIGPQHPSTHGVLRLVAKVDGEKISSVEPVLGYMHRGYEKLAEVRTYPQITTLVNRIDWVSGFANEIPFIAATEKLMEIDGKNCFSFCIQWSLCIRDRGVNSYIFSNGG